jgi:NADH-quinone oxidoreductase subunit E
VPEAGGPGQKPETLSTPRASGADDLTQIRGIGPKLAGVLHEMGVYHFDQIASWSDAEVAWVDANLKGFRGRVSRDDWVTQAKALRDQGQGA